MLLLIVPTVATVSVANSIHMRARVRYPFFHLESREGCFVGEAAHVCFCVYISANRLAGPFAIDPSMSHNSCLCSHFKSWHNLKNAPNPLVPSHIRLPSRRRAEPAPWSPNVKAVPVLACDHPLGREDGHDRPHMLDDVLNPSRLHKCVHDFVQQTKDSVRRYLSPLNRLWLSIGTYTGVFLFLSSTGCVGGRQERPNPTRPNKFSCRSCLITTNF